MSVSRLGGQHFTATVLLCVWAMEANATVLLFDQIRELDVVTPTISGNNVPQDYGDRVAGALQSVAGGQFTYGEAGEGFTPNVVVDYFVSSAAGPSGVSLWRDNYGDLTNVAFGNQNSITLNVRLTADSGFSAVLHHFDLGGWPNADYTINAVRVLDRGNVLFSQSNVLVEGDTSGPRHTSFDYANPPAGAELLIEVDYSNLPGNQQDNIGIDNIRFGQEPPAVIPEPTARLLLSIGLPFLYWRLFRGRPAIDSSRCVAGNYCSASLSPDSLRSRVADCSRCPQFGQSITKISRAFPLDGNKSPSSLTTSASCPHRSHSTRDPYGPPIEKK